MIQILKICLREGVVYNNILVYNIFYYNYLRKGKCFEICKTKWPHPRLKNIYIYYIHFKALKRLFYISVNSSYPQWKDGIVEVVSNYLFMKTYKTYKIKCFRRKYLKTSKNRDCGEYFPPIIKKYKNRNKRKRKGKEKESYIFIVYIIFDINWWWIVSIFRQWQLLGTKMLDLFVMLKKKI